MGFWSALVGGSNPELNKDIKQASDISGFGEHLGEGDLSLASNINRALATGDQSEIARFLGPTMSAINKQGQQRNMTTAQFGNRSGGTNAGAQMTDDNTRSQINALIAHLTGQSVNNLKDIGEFGVNTAFQGNQINANESQQRMKNWEDSILGRGVTEAASEAESYGLGKLFPQNPSGGGGGGGGASPASGWDGSYWMPGADTYGEYGGNAGDPYEGTI